MEYDPVAADQAHKAELDLLRAYGKPESRYAINLHQIDLETLFSHPDDRSTHRQLQSSIRSTLSGNTFTIKDNFNDLDLLEPLKGAFTIHTCKDYTDAVHQIVTGLYGTNEIEIPNFCYLYSAFQAGTSIDRNVKIGQEPLMTATSALNKVWHMVFENPGVDLVWYLQDASDVKKDTILLQLFLALHVAHEQIGYIQNQVIYNITVKELPEPITIKYPLSTGDIYLTTSEIIKIRPGEYSSFVYNGVRYGPYSREAHNLGIYNIDLEMYDTRMILTEFPDHHLHDLFVPGLFQDMLSRSEIHQYTHESCIAWLLDRHVYMPGVIIEPKAKADLGLERPLMFGSLYQLYLYLVGYPNDPDRSKVITRIKSRPLGLEIMIRAFINESLLEYASFAKQENADLGHRFNQHSRIHRLKEAAELLSDILETPIPLVFPHFAQVDASIDKLYYQRGQDRYAKPEHRVVHR